MASPVLHKIHNHKSGVVGGVMQGIRMKNSTIYMLVFWLAMFIFGYLDFVFENSKFNGSYYLVSMFISVFFMFVWFIEDSRQINVQPSNTLKILVVAVGFLVIPYYLVKYKGWHKSLISFSKFTGFLLLYIGYLFGVEYLFHPSA